MKRILIIKLSSMGDVLHALPVLSDIKNYLGEESQIDWVTEPGYSCLLKDHPHIDNLYTLPFRKYPGYIRSIYSPEAKALHKTFNDQPAYDAILDLQGLLKSAWVCRWAKGKRFGYDSKSIREPWASWLYNKKLGVSKNQHAVCRMRELAAKALGYAVPTTDPVYNLNARGENGPPGHIARGPSVRSTQQPTKLQLILFPNTTWETKHWPLEHWQALINLTQQQFNIFITWGSPAELELANNLSANYANCQPTPDLNISGMKNFLKHCDAFVGVDTGFAHLATAMDIPGIVLMGPTDKNKSGPLGKKQIALDIDLPCRPCHKRECALPVETNKLRPACLAGITPELVLSTLKRLSSA